MGMRPSMEQQDTHQRPANPERRDHPGLGNKSAAADPSAYPFQREQLPRQGYGMHGRHTGVVDELEEISRRLVIQRIGSYVFNHTYSVTPSEDRASPGL